MSETKSHKNTAIHKFLHAFDEEDRAEKAVKKAQVAHTKAQKVLRHQEKQLFKYLKENNRYYTLNVVGDRAVLYSQPGEGEEYETFRNVRVLRVDKE